MDSTTALTWVSFFIALVAGGGLTLQRQRVTILRGDLEDARKRVEDLRGDLVEAERERSDDRTRIATLEGDLRHAERMATGEAQWTKFGEQLSSHHTAAMSKQDQTLAKLATLHGDLVRLAGAISGKWGDLE